MNNNYEYVKRVKENKEEQEKLKEQLQNIIDIIDLPEDEQKKLIDEVLANALETYSPNNMINFQAYLKNKLKKEIERKYFTPSTIIPIEKQKIINLFLSKRNDKFLTEEEIRKKLQIDSGTLYQGISILSSQSNKIKSELLRIFPNYKQQLKERKVYFKQPITLSETDLRYLGYYIGEINDICLDIHEIAIKEGKNDIEIEKQLKTIFQLLTDKSNMELVKKQYPQCEMMLQIKAANFGIKLNKEKTKIEKERATNPINETPKQPQKEKKKTNKKEKKEKPLLTEREETTLKELAKNPNIKREKLIELVGYTSLASLYTALKKIKEKCQEDEKVKEKVLELYPNFLTKEKPLLTEKQETILKELAQNPNISSEELRKKLKYQSISTLYSALYRIREKCQEDEKAKAKVLELYPDFLKPKEKVKEPKKERPLLSEKEETILKGLATTPTIKKEELRELAGYKTLNSLLSAINRLKNKCKQNELVKEKVLELYPDFLTLKENKTLSESEKSLLLALQSSKTPLPSLQSIIHNTICKSKIKVDKKIASIKRKSEKSADFSQAVLTIYPKFFEQEEYISQFSEQQLNLLLVLKDHYEKPMTKQQIADTLNYKNKNNITSLWKTIKEKVENNEKAKSEALAIHPKFLEHKISFVKKKRKATKTHKKETLTEEQEKILTALKQKSKIQEIAEELNYKSANTVYATIYNIRKKCQESNTFKEEVLAIYPEFLIPKDKSLSETSLSEKEIQVLQGLYLITPPQTTYLSQKELATMFQCQQPIISKIKEQALKKIAEQKEIQEELQKTWPTFNQDKTIKEQYKSSRSVKMPREDVEGIKDLISQFNSQENKTEKPKSPILTGIKNLEESVFSPYISQCTEEQKAMLALRLGFINAPSTTETVAKLFNVEQQEVITLTKNCLQSAKSSLKEKPLQKKKGELRKS